MCTSILKDRDTNAKYFQTLSGEKWQSLTNSLPSILQLCSRLQHRKLFDNLKFWTRCLAALILLLLLDNVEVPNVFQLDRCQTL